MSTTTEIQGETKQHLSDLVALESHILEAVEHQIGTDNIKKDADALMLLQETHAMLSRHSEELDALVIAQDAETRTGIKNLFTGFLGNIAGLYNKVRGEEATRAIRDTYTALSLLSVSLTALKTFGLMVGKPDISKLAYEQMRDLLPLIMKINHRLPYIVARDVAERSGMPYDVAVPERVEKATQRIWNRED